MDGSCIGFLVQEAKLSTSIYDLVLIYVCHFHHHHPLRVSQIWPVSRYSCCYLGSLHPRNFVKKVWVNFCNHHTALCREEKYNLHNISWIWWQSIFICNKSILLGFYVNFMEIQSYFHISFKSNWSVVWKLRSFTLLPLIFPEIMCLDYFAYSLFFWSTWK